MVINMEAYYAQDQLQMYRHQISSLHLSYLEMVESPQKMEQRNKLEDCINEYLYMAPQEHKFFFHQTAEVLYRSTVIKEDFSGYKAAVAFNAIGRYAENLLSQPWRKEYRMIKTYCGFFKHQIDANLSNANIMFEAMGYKYYHDGILILEEPICPDTVTQVSQDSIIAYVECQIIKTIWEQVKSAYPITWLDVLTFRQNYICDAKHAVQALKFKQEQRQYQDHHRCYAQGSDPFNGIILSSRYPTTTTASSANHHHLHNAQPTTNNHHHHHHHLHHHSFPPLSGHTHLQQAPMIPPSPPLPPPPPCIYAGNSYYSTYPMSYAHCLVPSFPQQQQHQQQYPATNNGYCYANGFQSQPQTQPTPVVVPAGYVRPPVPTAQLIELDHNYDVPDGLSSTKNTTRSSNSRTSPEPMLLATRNKFQNDGSHGHRILNNNGGNAKEEGSGTFESWDYVYKNLESQGYSKDLGERGDILGAARRAKSTDLEDGLAHLNLTNRKSKKINTVDDADRICKVITPSSSYDNLSTDCGNNKKSYRVALTQNKSASMPKESYTKFSETVAAPPSVKTKPVVASTTINTKTLDIRRSPKMTQPLTNKKEQTRSQSNGNNNHNIINAHNNNNNNVAAAATANAGSWSCQSCTYLNKPAADICEMCCKSRTPIMQEMEVGGAQCSNCTLVNPKSNKTCDACNNTLKDSPTYI